MIKPLLEAGPQHCFPTDDGFMCCNYTKRKIKNVLVAIFPNVASYVRFPIPWNWKPKKKSQQEKGAYLAPNSVAPSVEIVINPQVKNEKTPVLENKGSNRL